MTASISLPARAGRHPLDHLAGFGPLFRKELREWSHSKRIWVILAITTAFMALTAANGAINAWVVANVPDAEVSDAPIVLDPLANFLTAIASQIFVVVAIFVAMSLIVTERDRGTLAWVASKPVSRAAIWLSKGAAAAVVLTIVAGIIPMAATFAVATGLYGPFGIETLVFATIGVAGGITFMIAVVLAASVVVSNQAAVAAIGFAVFFLPQLLGNLVGIDLAPVLPSSIVTWALGPVLGTEMGLVTPIAWAVSLVALAGFASWRMERLEF
jgi:ABC-type transport system involved in multi-copper enzyme maturation permease subunit